MRGGKPDQATVTVSAPDGYKIPDGDLVYFECWIDWGQDNQIGVLTNGKTTIGLEGCNTKGEHDSWVCKGTYVGYGLDQGDPEFAPSYSGATIKPPKC
jgi:hypothetical protein